MHHDVTLNYVPANTNQRYSNSLLSPSGVYLFQARFMHSDSWVWREVKKREEKKEGDMRRPPPTLPLAIVSARIFLRRPHDLN